MMNQNNQWPKTLGVIFNALANIILALAALAVVGLFAYYKHYYLAAGLVSLGIFVYVILQFVEALLKGHEVLTAQMLHQEEFYRNWLNYLMDVKRGVDPVVAHNINNTPIPIPPGEPEEAVMDFLAIDGVPVRRSRD